MPVRIEHIDKTERIWPDPTDFEAYTATGREQCPQGFERRAYDLAEELRVAIVIGTVSARWIPKTYIEDLDSRARIIK
tara:strand:+ start:918 stop:1151 length:234 start_codon:yes stop_codon:yes gene_type:complete